MNGPHHGSLRIAGAVRRVATVVGVVGWIAFGTGDLSAQTGPWSGSPSAAAPPAATYWRERIFLIPYQVQPLGGLEGQLGTIELLVSQDGATDWRSLGKAESNVQGFRYFAPTDGDYWFALQLFDHRGKLLQSGPIQPQLHVVVDTLPPVLSIAGSLDVDGAVVLRYEATDRNLKPIDLTIQSQTDGRTWIDVPIGQHDVKQSDRVMGRVRLPDLSRTAGSWGGGSVKFRASIADRAGHVTRATTEVVLDGPQLRSPGSPRLDRMPGSTMPGETALGRDVAIASPPARTPYATTANASRGERNLSWPPLESSHRTPAQLVASGQAGRLAGSDNGLPAPSRQPVSPSAPTADSQGWTGKSSLPEGPPDKAMRLVASRTFDIEYDLASVGPWGVAKVELWGTSNQGQTWESYCIDQDNRSPVRVTVPKEGIYGFRILVDGANGASSPPPRSGDPPELMVRVDLNRPVAQLLPIEHGRGNLVDHLVLRWTAGDDNLEPRPISLFYSSSPHGPWSTIAARLDNTGQYFWRIQRHVPEQFYLRLEVRDTAGNLTVAQLPTPVTLNRPQPTGRLRGVRPIDPREAREAREAGAAPVVPVGADRTAQGPPAQAADPFQVRVSVAP